MKRAREEDSPRLTAEIGPYLPAVEAARAGIEGDRVVERIREGDHTVWKPEPSEITDRLGWLRIARVMGDDLGRIRSAVRAVKDRGYTRALLLGMGGSSLAPEVFRRTFGVKDGGLDLTVLDSTDPGAVLAQADRLDPEKTLFLVATKSGGTVETLSFFKYFYNRLVEALGKERAGEHFIAITDPGSKLVDLARRYGFRETFLNDPNIGGRYSALSYFGLVPAALVGVDLDKLLERALSEAASCGVFGREASGESCAVRLGAILGELARAGRDKMTLIISPAVASFGDWVEQLIAESTGKEGRGILPVVGEPVGPPGVYGADRLFVYLRLAGDETHDESVKALEDAGQPVIKIELKDLYDLGGQFFLWEMATAVAGAILKINPFDQPNVEAAKLSARRMLESYHREGKLPELTPALKAEGITVYGEVEAGSPGEALSAFLAPSAPGAYVSLQAYLPPGGETDRALLALRTVIRDRTKLATTVGYGPRFLHSTGQFHKGGAGNGFFIQFTAEALRDAPIPAEAGNPSSFLTFGLLEAAQALGDRQALIDAGRSVIRFDLGADAVESLKRLTEALS